MTTARPLKVGLLLPETEGQFNGATAGWADLLAMTRAAEDAGFDSIWVTDHLIQRDETSERGMWECWSLISAIAASTTRVEIGTLVLSTSFRNPALLAKMADTVDEISAGRLILGIGAGWHEPEYSAFGYPFDHRVDRFEEAATVVAGLLRDGRIDFSGAHYQVRDCVLRPRGPRPNGPPIMIGTSGSGPRMLRLAARFADQWNVWFKTFNNRLEDLAGMREVVDAACRDVGRDPATLARTAALKIEVGPHAPSPMSTDPITGSPAEIADTLRRYAAIGISHVQVWIEPTNLDGIAAFAPVLSLLDAGHH
jgi:alkanesulfonate monooxygenase SsuD/methylene tetrahydromethanopterin reductase-like flavin-dependent oxidoreductase (luciferase family)